MIPGVEFIEMEGADKCCGGAGTFSFNQHDTLRQEGRRAETGREPRDRRGLCRHPLSIL